MLGQYKFKGGISIHALREESDMSRATISIDGVISIHALREESDERQAVMPENMPYFNPRSP